LDDLAVGAPGEVRRLFEAGAFVLADQLDAVGKPRLLAGPAFGRRSVVVDRKNLRLVCRRRLCRRRGDVGFSFRTNEGRTPPPLASSRAA